MYGMVVENGAIWFTSVIFLFPMIAPWQAQSMDTRHSTGKNRVMPHSSRWLVWVCGVINGLICVGFSWCSWLNVFYDARWTCKRWLPHWGGILPWICKCSGILIPPHIATASQESLLHEHLGHHLYSKWSKLGGLHNWKAW